MSLRSHIKCHLDAEARANPVNNDPDQLEPVLSSDSDSDASDVDADVIDEPPRNWQNLLYEILEDPEEYQDIFVPSTSLQHNQPFVYHKSSGLIICLKHRAAFTEDRLAAHIRKNKHHSVADGFINEFQKDVFESCGSLERQERKAFLEGLETGNVMPLVEVKSLFKCGACGVIRAKNTFFKRHKGLTVAEKQRHQVVPCKAVELYLSDVYHKQYFEYIPSQNAALPAAEPDTAARQIEAFEEIAPIS